MCAAVCTIANAAEPEKKDVDLSVGPMILNYIPVLFTWSLDDSQKEGLNVRVEDFQAGGSKALQALTADSTDAVVGFHNHTIHTQVQGKDIMSVASFNVMPGIMLTMRPDPDIKNGEDLKSKKIGITAPGSSTGLFACYYTTKNGLQANDASYIAVGSGMPDMLAPNRKKADTLVNFDSVASPLEKRRAAKFFVDMRTDVDSSAIFGGRYLIITLYVTYDFTTKSPETV